MSLAEVWLEAHEIAPHAQLSTVRKERNSVLGLGIRGMLNQIGGAQVDLLCCVRRDLTSFGGDFKKRATKEELLSTRVAYLAPSGHGVRQWVLAFLSLFLDRLS